MTIQPPQTEGAIDEVIARSLRQIVRFLRFDGAVLYSWAPDLNVLWPLTSCGDLFGRVPPALPDLGLVGAAFGSAAPLIADHAVIASMGEAWLQAENVRTAVALPLGAGAETIGVLTVFSLRGIHVDQQMLRAVSVFARQLSSAMRRAPLLATADIQRRQIEAVTKIVAAAAAEKIVDETALYDTMACEARLLTGAHAVMFLRSERLYAFRENRHATPARRWRLRSFHRRARAPARVPRTVLRSEPVAQNLTLALVWRSSFMPTDQQRRLVELIANAVSAVEGLRVRVAMAEQTRRAQYLFDVSRALSASLDLQVVLEQVQKLFVPSSADCIAVFTPYARGDDADAVARVFGNAPSLLNDAVGSVSMAGAEATGRYTCERFEPPLEGDIAEAVIVPMVSEGRGIGSVGFGRSTARGSAGPEDSALYVELASYAAAAITNVASFRKERDIADILQHALLPTVLPVDPRVLFAAAYVPAGAQAHVGGDWYDVFMLDNDRFAVSIGDVCGHGTYAAVTMNVVRLALRTAALGEQDPLRVIERADAVLGLEREPPMVTAIYGIVDLKRRAFSYACAGHLPPLLVKCDGSMATLPTFGVPLGIGFTSERKRFETVLAPGDTLVLYTDGLVEYARDSLEGDRRLHELLQTLIDRGSHATLAGDLHAVTFGSGAVQSDDVAVLTMSLRPAERATPWEMLSVPSSLPAPRERQVPEMR